MLSARAGEEPASRGIQSGADDYLVKPFSARELVGSSLCRDRASPSQAGASPRKPPWQPRSFGPSLTNPVCSPAS